MKRVKDSRVSELTTDVVEYMFIEWLCRRGVFPAFKANYDSTRDVDMPFRTALRRHISHTSPASRSCIGDLVASSFMFAGTPEGRDFWLAVSTDWRRFCIEFRNLF